MNDDDDDEADVVDGDAGDGRLMADERPVAADVLFLLGFECRKVCCRCSCLNCPPWG